MSDFRAAMDADFKMLLNGEFSEGFTIAGPGSQVATVRGIWDDTYQELDEEKGSIVMSSKPRVTVWAADASFELAQGQVVTRTKTGKQYKIKRPEPDGEGSVTLYF